MKLTIFKKKYFYLSLCLVMFNSVNVLGMNGERVTITDDTDSNQNGVNDNDLLNNIVTNDSEMLNIFRSTRTEAMDKGIETLTLSYQPNIAAGPNVGRSRKERELNEQILELTNQLTQEKVTFQKQENENQLLQKQLMQQKVDFQEAQKKNSEDQTNYKTLFATRAGIGIADAFGQQIGSFGGQLLLGGIVNVYHMLRAQFNTTFQTENENFAEEQDLAADGQVDLSKLSPQEFNYFMAMQKMQMEQEDHAIRVNEHLMKKQHHMINMSKKETQFIHNSLNNIEFLKTENNMFLKDEKLRKANQESEALKQNFRNHLRTEVLLADIHFRNKAAMLAQEMQEAQQKGRNRTA